jgi:phosphate butyryltransferase
VVLACGHDPAALEALSLAEERGLARAILVGDPGLIGPALEKLPRRLQDAEIVDAPDEESSVAKAVELVRNRTGKVLLKGKTQTGTLLKAVLDRDNGLRTGKLLSDAFLFEYPAASGTRLVCITDGGINLSPDLQAKKQILENSVTLYHALGFPRPRVSVLSAVETVIPGHTPSQDAVALVKMAAAGQLMDCEVEGPLSLDLSLSEMAVQKKGHDGPVAGKADILLCPEIISANLLAKSTTYFAGYRLAHVIMGATAPVLIPSRSDSPEAKFYSIALGAMTVK